jgi:hypothetical protein
MAARFEQVRGDHKRAAAFWKASMDAMPEVNPGSKLAHLLDQAEAQRHTVDKNLAVLLDPENHAAGRPSQPSLPSYRSAGGGSSVAPTSTSEDAALYGPDPYSQGTAPVPWNVGSGGGAARATSSARTGTGLLGGYVPPAGAQPVQDDAEAFAPPELVKHEAKPAIGLRRRSAPVPAEQSVAEQPVMQPVEPPVMQAAAETVATASPKVQFLKNSESAQGPLTLTPVQMRSPIAESSSLDEVAEAPRQQELPALRGSEPLLRAAVRPVDPRDAAQRQLDAIAAGYSPWSGGTGYATHRTGEAGFDRLTILEAPFEMSGTVGDSTRFTLVVTPSFLDAGTADGKSLFQLGTAAVGATPAQQLSSGMGGEVQISTSNFGLSGGVTPYGFLVSNWIGRLNWRPAAGRFTFSFSRDAVKDSQLSYAGLHDPGSAGPTYPGDVWGGVIANTGGVQYGKGDANSGYYFGMGGQYLTGRNVLSNQRIDGVAGAYFKVLRLPDVGELTLGANFFGMHYANNLRFFTYGQGGYFSPNAYFLANLPFTFEGHGAGTASSSALHYTIGGAFGVQAFQEASSYYYPLQGPYLTKVTGPMVVVSAPLTTVVPNPQYPAQVVVGGNYDLHAQASYRLMDRWYLGGFLNVNNTRNYNSQTAGFFLRYMMRPQYAEEGGPTGIFPYQGQRPVMVP